MNKFKTIGIILILFVIYTPISLFNNIPPFGADVKDVYVYDSIPLVLNELPDDIEIKEIGNSGVKIRTYNQIQNPEYYGLELNKKTREYESNFWYYPAMVIAALCFSVGLRFIVHK